MTSTDKSPPAFPGADICEALNRGARLLYKETPNETPCIEVAGVQCYLYLDAKSERLVVSVHLDGADDSVFGDHCPVPLEVVVEGESLFLP